jgi:hypothetical protein
MYRRFLLAGVLVSLFVTKVSAQGNVGEPCESDGDCIGNLDCIATGVWEQKCFPITCAKGAAQAMLDFGFNSQAYVNKVINDAGFASETDFLMMGDENSTQEYLLAALAKDVPPMEVFNANLTACMNPKKTRRDRGLQTLDEVLTNSVFQDGRTAYGIQWSAAALVSLFRKVTQTTLAVSEAIPEPDTKLDYVSNCIGFLLGGDIGLDFLIQIFSGRQSDFISDFSRSENLTTTKATEIQATEFNPGTSQYASVFTAGPFGVQVGWFQSEGPSEQTITEITFGPSFGMSLGGFSQCYNLATISQRFIVV